MHSDSFRKYIFRRGIYHPRNYSYPFNLNDNNPKLHNNLDFLFNGFVLTADLFENILKVSFP